MKVALATLSLVLTVACASPSITTSVRSEHSKKISKVLIAASLVDYRTRAVSGYSVAGFDFSKSVINLFGKNNVSVHYVSLSHGSVPSTDRSLLIENDKKLILHDVAEINPSHILFMNLSTVKPRENPFGNISNPSDCEFLLTLYENGEDAPVWKGMLVIPASSSGDISAIAATQIINKLKADGLL